MKKIKIIFASLILFSLMSFSLTIYQKIVPENVQDGCDQNAMNSLRNFEHNSGIDLNQEQEYEYYGHVYDRCVNHWLEISAVVE